MSIFKEPMTPATDVQIAEAQAEWGYVLPTDFARFLKLLNGGNIKQKNQKFIQIIDSNGQSDEFYLTNLYGIQSDEHLDILPMMRGYRPHPDWLVPVGSVHNGPTFVLDIRSDPYKFGKIYLYIMDHSENPEPVFEPEEFVDGDADLSDDETAEDAYGEAVAHYWFVTGSFAEFLDKFSVSID